MLNSEKVFDMLPHVVDIYDKLKLDDYRKEIAKNQTGETDSLSVGIDVVKYMLKNSPKVKEEFFNVVAIFEGKTVEEVKSRPFIQTMATFKQIFSDKELTDFFKSAMQ